MDIVQVLHAAKYLTNEPACPYPTLVVVFLCSLQTQQTLARPVTSNTQLDGSGTATPSKENAVRPKSVYVFQEPPTPEANTFCSNELLAQSHCGVDHSVLMMESHSVSPAVMVKAGERSTSKR